MVAHLRVLSWVFTSVGDRGYSVLKHTRIRAKTWSQLENDLYQIRKKEVSSVDQIHNQYVDQIHNQYEEIPTK